MQHWLTNATVFTGHEWIRQCHVCVEDDQIKAVTTVLPSEAEAPYDCKGHMLVPAFIDLQIYGGGGKLFAQYPEVDSLASLVAHNRKGGTVQCLVTIATQPIETILRCLDVLNDYMSQGGEGILGMHLEGPFLNASKRGAHVQEWIKVPDTDAIMKILEHARGHLRMMTVAPECCSDEALQLLLEAGVVLSAGHSNAHYEAARQFADRGVKTVTHLFNAMSSIHHRQPGIPVAVMEDDRLHASIIPDGIHVDYAMVRMAKKLMGRRLFFITDAVTPTAEGPYQHIFRDDHYALPDGTLSGSSLSMIQAVRNGIMHVGLASAESIRMASLYPATIIDIAPAYGCIEAGSKAAMVLINDSWEIEKIFGF